MIQQGNEDDKDNIDSFNSVDIKEEFNNKYSKKEDDDRVGDNNDNENDDKSDKEKKKKDRISVFRFSAIEYYNWNRDGHKGTCYCLVLR